MNLNPLESMDYDDIIREIRTRKVNENHDRLTQLILHTILVQDAMISFLEAGCKELRAELRFLERKLDDRPSY